MSFTTNKPAEGATPPAVTLRVAGRASAPLSGAEVMRSVRLHPWLALSVGCVVTGALAGYALSGRAAELVSATAASVTAALLAAALVLGVICAAVAAVLAQRRNGRIYGEGDIEQLTGLLPLAILPARGEVASGAYEAHMLRLAGAIAGAKRSRGAKSFLLTAVSSGTDIEPLLEALRRKLEETGFGVTVAATGDLLRPVAEVSQGGFVEANLARLTRDGSVVLVEAGALLYSAETEFVAHCVDATVLVVECAVTTRQELWRAAGLLARMQVPGAGAVLEELPMRLADAGYRATIETAEKAPLYRRPAAARSETASDLIAEPAAAPEKREELPFPDSAGQDSAGQDAVGQDAVKLDAGRRGLDEAVAGPMLVERSVERPVPIEEKAAEQARPASGAEIAREKMEAELSARRRLPAADGEPGMKRRMGWLGRLLGRDAAPASIIPTDDEDEEAAWLSRPAAEEDYSAPLATRLDAISRQRPVASASASKPSTRLQIVPQEAPREIFVPAARALEDERVRELGAPEFPSVATLGAASLAEVEAPSATEGDVALSGSEHEEARAEELAEPVNWEEPETELEPETVPEAGSEGVPEPVAFEADHFERLFFGLSEFAGEPYEVQPEFGMAAPGRLNDLLTQQEREWEAGLAVEPEHAQAEEPGPAWAGSERGLSGDDEPGDGAEEHRPASRDRHTGYEVLAFVPELKTPSEVEWRSQWQEPIEPEAISTAAADGDAEDRDAETKTMEAAEPVRDEPVYSAAPVYREPAYSEPVPSEPVGEKFPIEYDADDIEPVLEEASRHLAPSRWDPIPTLRPDSNGWRDRPSPMPPTNPGAERRRWTGEDQDLEAWRSGPASGSGPRMDSLPEPLLTRQWGLLSKFQQSRLSSGSRPVAKTEEDEPVSNGNHKS